ncbi:MAG TPA: uroporphyrinogen-III C-methyltransferase [Polyangiaceae bacterium]
MFDDVKVWLVGAGPGDPTLITVKGLRCLQNADVVLYDALAHPALLEECRADAKLVSVGKRYGVHTVEQSEIIRLLIEHARLGLNVVRLKGGDPYLFARGAEEAEALADAGVRFGVVPGIASPLGTSTYAGFSLTHRDLSSSVTFVTGTDRHGEHHRPEDWHRLATASDTLCILMGMRRIEAIAQSLIDGGRAGDTPTAVIEWGARPEQRVLVATLGTVAARVREVGLSNPAVIVVGEVVRLREKLRWFDSRPLFGKRLLLPRAAAQAASTAQLIRERGAEPIAIPLIAIDPAPDTARVSEAVRSLASYDWVVFTSANGAERLIAALQAEQLDARAFGQAKIAVIGPRTAEPLRRFGLRPDLVAERYVAEGLVHDLLQQRNLGRVLVFRAEQARELLPEQLRASGAHVDVVAAYRTRRLSSAQAESLAEALARRAFDAILLTSSSMAAALVEALGSTAQQDLRNVVVASIGPVTTATLAELGVQADVTSDVHTIDALLGALEAYFGARGLASSC